MPVATSSEREPPARVPVRSVSAEPSDSPMTERCSRDRRAVTAWVVPAALFGGTLAVYVRTLRPSFGWLDTSELITAAYHLGIGHNPGYPTFMIIGHLFSWLPIGTVAYRLNLMAAVMGALAVVLLYLVCLRAVAQVPKPRQVGAGTAAPRGGLAVSNLRSMRIASALAALTLAFSYTFWDLTTEAEVYTLHACLMLGAILALLRWRDEGRDRDLYLGWLVVGVSMGNHALTALMIPALALLMLLERGGRQLWPRRIRGCAGAFLAGAAVYLYVPLRAMANPPPEVNNPHTLRAFWQLLSAPGCRPLMFSMSAGEVALRTLGFARRTVRELGPFGIGPALLGVGPAMRTDARLTAALLLLLGVDVSYAVNYNIFDIYSYFLPAYLVLAVFLAVGLERIIAWGARALLWLQRGIEKGLTAPRRTALVAALLTYLPVWGFSANFRLVDASQDRQAEDFARNAFAAVERGAVIIGDWWSIAPLGYLKYVEGLRPDVTLSVALSSWDPAGARRVLRRGFLASYPAAYIAEHQTSWRGAFERRYAHEAVGDLTRIYANGKPRLRGRVDSAPPAYRFGDALGLVATACRPREVAQGEVLRITHRWRKLSPIPAQVETLTRIEGPDGCIWRVRSDLANGCYDPSSWRPGEVAEERHVAFIPGDAPPGDYAITVRARHKRENRSLPVWGRGGSTAACEATTAAIRITPRTPRPAPAVYAPRQWRSRPRLAQAQSRARAAETTGLPRPAP